MYIGLQAREPIVIAMGLPSLQARSLVHSAFIL
jgi:hypothetical protein